MKRFLFFIFLFFPIAAFAVTVKPTFWYNSRGITSYTEANAQYLFNNVDAACRNWYDVSFSSGNNLISYSISNSSPNQAGTCYLIMTTRSSGANANNSQGIQTVLTCPAGFTLNFNNTNYAASTCLASSCPAGMTANSSGECIDNCSVIKDQTTQLSVNCSATNFPSSVCLPNNCAANSLNAAIGFDKPKNCYFGTVTVKLTGITCNGQQSSSAFTNPTSADPAPADTPEANCIKQGQSYGVVNGVAVCVPKSSSSATPISNNTTSTTTTTTTGTDGKQNTTKTTEVKNVTQDGDQVVATTTKTNADGTKTESTTSQPYTEFCAQNPNQSICKKDTEDDTSSACEDNPDLPQCFSRGEAEDGDVIAETTKTVSFTPKAITSSVSCPANKSVSLFGHSSTIDYTPVCTYASDFRPFIIAFAYLSAAMFLFWGYKGSQA